MKVWFDEVGAFIEGTVTKVSKPRSKKAGALGRLIVNYDDGDQGFCDYPERGSCGAGSRVRNFRISSKV